MPAAKSCQQRTCLGIDSVECNCNEYSASCASTDYRLCETRRLAIKRSVRVTKRKSWKSVSTPVPSVLLTQDLPPLEILRRIVYRAMGDLVAATTAVGGALTLLLLLFWGQVTTADAQPRAEANEMARPQLHVVRGSTAGLFSIAFSPDGRFVVASARNRTLQVWDTSLRRQVAVLDSASDWVQAVAFSPDGKLLAAATTNGASLWRTSDWTLERKLVPGKRVSALAFFDEGSSLVVMSSVDQVVQLLSLADGKVKDSLESAGTAFAVRGVRVYASSYDGNILDWTPGNGVGPRVIKQGRKVSALALAKQGSLAVAAVGNAAAVIDLTAGTEILNVAHDSQVTAVAVSSDGTLAASTSADNSAATIKVWELRTGELRGAWRGHKNAMEGLQNKVNTLTFSPDDRVLASGGSDNRIRLWNLESLGAYDELGTDSDRVFGVGFSPRDQWVAVSGDRGVRIWAASEGAVVGRYDHKNHFVNHVAFTGSGSLVASGDDGVLVQWSVSHPHVWQQLQSRRTDILGIAPIPLGRQLVVVYRGGGIKILDDYTGMSIETYQFSTRPMQGRTSLPSLSTDSDFIAFTFDGQGLVMSRARKEERVLLNEKYRFSTLSFSEGDRLLAGLMDGSVGAWSARTGAQLIAPHRVHGETVHHVAYSAREDLALSVANDGTAALWRASTLEPLHKWQPHRESISGAAFSADGRLFALASRDQSVSLWETASRRELGRLVTFASGRWAVVAPDGRFDTNSLEESSQLLWQMPDDPRRPAPVELLMRDFYEPRLLPKILASRSAGLIRSVSDLMKLNRVQPLVSIVKMPETGTGQATVTVRVQTAEDATQPNGKTATAAYDLRLFRNGQLVGQWPEPMEGSSGPRDISAWRKESLVPMESGQTKAEHTFRVALPSRERGKPMVFTAYAFNEDRVKSETARNDEFKVPEDMALRKPRAYVITVGIDAYDNPDRDLSFAAKDAKEMGAALARINDHEVVRLTLVSERRRGSGLTATRQATKANIRAVLELLAGRSETERVRLKRVPGIDKKAIDQLRKATPDDLVIIAFSGHGYTEASGQFYLLPSDSGTESEITSSVLEKFISSDDLSQWLREVDAGQMAMIIDACHSAASVDAPGFKPGPMGDRGLGQLAYDKGMMILAATQASDVALEVQKIQQGLLTYALVADGLKKGSSEPKRHNADLNKNGVLTLKEWLQYGERRVPALYDEIRTGKLEVVRRDPTPVEPNWRETIARKAQTPTLFDFQRRSNIAELVP